MLLCEQKATLRCVKKCPVRDRGGEGGDREGGGGRGGQVPPGGNPSLLSSQFTQFFF